MLNENIPGGRSSTTPGAERGFAELIPSSSGGVQAVLLFVGFARLYFATRSPGLDEGDSVQFAMGVLPALLFYISLPLALKHHTQDGPPLLFARYLERHYPPNERGGVLLLLSQTRRHVQWYAPGFDLAPKDQSVAETPPEQLASAKAIYTDNPKIALRPGWKLVRGALYHRSILIAPKHRIIGVYQVERIANK